MSLTLRRVHLVGHPEPSDVTIDGGVISRIQPGGGRPDGEGVDADGRWLVPGFWDEHVHFRLWAELSRRLDVSAAQSAAEVVALVGQAVARGADFVIATGFRDALWPDAPHRDLLDQVTGGAEAYVISGDLHSIWLNSAALHQIDRPDHPTGLLREADCFSVTWSLSDVSDEVRDAWVAQAAAAAASRGLVGIVDLDLSRSLDDWRRREAAGLASLRVAVGIPADALDQAESEGLSTGQPLGSTGLLSVGPLKIVADGSLNTRTAWCFDPYPGLNGPEACGLNALSKEELADLMIRGRAAGLTPAVHAIGDRANAMVLDAFQAVGVGGRIEHAQLLRWEDVGRFAQLGVTASVQPEHALDDRDVADRYWAGRTDRAFSWRSLLQAGATLALGSDAPVAPLDPWITLAAAVSRTHAGREPWHPEQRIDVAAAIQASTRGQVVAVGATADLQLIDRDPLTATPEELRTMPVSATWVAGRPTHNELAGG
jgi:predicted amidohydrolase YtcJ